MRSPFLQLPITTWIAGNDLALAIPAPLPVSPGHTLIVPRRLVASYFDATREEKTALWALVDEVKTALDEQLHPDGYEVTFTSGEVAEHTTPHAHVSLIPRFHEPRQPPLATGGDHDPLSQHLWPLFSTATNIAIVAAFVTETGLELLDEWVNRALRAGAQLRIVTGDYLAFNQVDALRLLLVWSQRDGHARDEAPDLPRRGQLRVRVVETAQPDGTERAFHPKCWLFESPSSGVAFVGSSNLSRSALQTGIEWNLRVERAIDPIAYASVHTAIDTLWATALELTEPWIDAYAQRVRQAPRSLPPADADAEPLDPPPPPHEFQEEALLALAQARQQGRRRALVVLATGLGKTWLAAFDIARVAASAGQWPRVLFLAHRQELLAQAERTFHRLLVAAGQPAQVGWCAGAGDSLELNQALTSTSWCATREAAVVIRRSPMTESSPQPGLLLATAVSCGAGCWCGWERQRVAGYLYYPRGRCGGCAGTEWNDRLPASATGTPPGGLVTRTSGCRWRSTFATSRPSARRSVNPRSGSPTVHGGTVPTSRGSSRFSKALRAEPERARSAITHYTLSANQPR